MGAQSCVDSTNIIACNAGYLKSSNNLYCTPSLAQLMYVLCVQLDIMFICFSYDI